MDYDWKGQVDRIVGGVQVAIHSCGQIVFGFSHIEGITLGAGVEVDEVDGEISVG